MDQELVQYLDGRFGRIDERFDRIEQRLDGHDRRFESIDRRFEAIDRRFESSDRRFEGLNDRFDEINERIRHNGVLIEGVRHELQQVAEGLIMHIEVRHREDREYFDRRFDDTHTLIRSFNTRVENLERKDQN